MTHTPLEHLDVPGPLHTAGRLILQADGSWHLGNAAALVPLSWSSPQPELRARDFARVHATWTGAVLEVIWLEVIAVQDRHALDGTAHISSSVMKRRAGCVTRMRRFFEARDFLEVRTPGLVAEPGTDVYIEPFCAPFIPEEQVERASPAALPAYLHTSPEFLMKRLLGKGFERIWQMTPAWRNGEITDLHAPEFTCVEWYRAWEGLEAIIEDTTQLITQLIGPRARVYDGAQPLSVELGQGFERVTMQELVHASCGFDILKTARVSELEEELSTRELLHKRGRNTGQMFGAARLGNEESETRESERWMELFFELQVTHLDPYLKSMGAVCLTHWPVQLAVLAARNAQDERVADRFEIYIGGVECCNGFRELTEAHEQRARFEEDLAQRARLGRPSYPMPEAFLQAMREGMPPSAGVALGFDRVVMLATGARTIAEVLPFSMRRGAQGGAPGFT